MLGQRLAGPGRLPPASVSERHVQPAAEAVGRVGGTLPVPHQHHGLRPHHGPPCADPPRPSARRRGRPNPHHD